jgi:hypothetical protein
MFRNIISRVGRFSRSCINSDFWDNEFRQTISLFKWFIIIYLICVPIAAYIAVYITNFIWSE